MHLLLLILVSICLVGLVAVTAYAWWRLRRSLERAHRGESPDDKPRPGA